MENFDLEKKGYNIQQVEDYIAGLKMQCEKTLADQKLTIGQLRQENGELRAKLDKYLDKDGQISSALVVAVETAKEIESTAKTVYELEIQRVKLLYSKWQAVLRQISAMYPEINEKSNVNRLFKDFEGNIVKILERENEINRIAEENRQDSKLYARNLLERIKETNYVKNNEAKQFPSTKTQPVVQIRRKDTIIPKVVEKNKKIDTNEVGEFEKFMNSEFDDFNSFQTGKTENVKQNDLGVCPAFTTPSDSGFDFKEALSPKEDLMDIMKIFDLDD